MAVPHYIISPIGCRVLLTRAWCSSTRMLMLNMRCHLRDDLQHQPECMAAPSTEHRMRPIFLCKAIQRQEGELAFSTSGDRVHIHTHNAVLGVPLLDSLGAPHVGTLVLEDGTVGFK
jgi:hypothetical protein